MSRKSLFIQFIVILLVVFVGATFVYKSERAKESTETIDRNRANLVRFHSPTLGNPESKVHIVEFLDPACETCADLYPHVKQILAANPDKVRLSIRHVAFHSGSDYVVKVLEAARKQGKYWQALEAVLASQGQWTRDHAVQPQLVWKALEGLGLSIDQIKMDMSAPQVAQQIAQDLSDANTLHVTKTPTFFVNGHPLPSFGLDHLQTLVKDEVQTAYR